MAYVYILRSRNLGDQLYVGCTANLDNRLVRHNQGCVPHTSKFRSWEAVYYESFDSMDQALRRERQIKKWSRAKKEALIAGDKERLTLLSRSKD